MTDRDSDRSSDRDPLRLHLASLREPQLPERLWTRIDQARARRLRRRWGAAGLALALALAAVVTLPLQPPQRPAPVTTTVARSVDPGRDGRWEAQVRALDRELQAAIRSNASDAEIEQFWVARRALLASRDGPPVQPVRI